MYTMEIVGKPDSIRYIAESANEIEIAQSMNEMTTEERKAAKIAGKIYDAILAIKAGQIMDASVILDSLDGTNLAADDKESVEILRFQIYEIYMDMAVEALSHDKNK